MAKATNTENTKTWPSWDS